jgi:hypothetical protein
VAQLVLWLQRCSAVAQLASVWMRTGGVARDGFNVVIAMMIKISINSEEEGLSISPVYFGGITGFQEEAPLASYAHQSGRPWSKECHRSLQTPEASPNPNPNRGN